MKCGLGIRRARLIIGKWYECPAMGREVRSLHGSLVPMASQPTAMAARNLMCDELCLNSFGSIQNTSGDYTKQPHSFRIASIFGIATLNMAAQAFIGVLFAPENYCRKL